MKISLAWTWSTLSLPQQVNANVRIILWWFEFFVELLNPWHAARRLIFPNLELNEDDLRSPFYSVALPDAFDEENSIGMNKHNALVNMIRSLKSGNINCNSPPLCLYRSQTKSFAPFFKRSSSGAGGSGYRTYVPAHKRSHNVKKFEILRFGK